jgi:hypothetical protein
VTTILPYVARTFHRRSSIKHSRAKHHGAGSSTTKDLIHAIVFSVSRRFSGLCSSIRRFGAGDFHSARLIPCSYDFVSACG